MFGSSWWGDYTPLLRYVLADDGESHPLNSYVPEVFLVIQKHPIALALTITVSSPISGKDEESLLDKKSKLAQFDDIKFLACFCQHQ